MNNIELTNIDKILFLGPQGSYSEIAKNIFIDKFDLKAKSIACVSISEIIEKVEAFKDEVLAVVPIENSIEGMVRESLDSLSKLAKFGIGIYAETNVQIEHNLIGFAKDVSEITEIHSHPQALAQCREFLVQNLIKNVRLVPVMSTSQGISLLTKEEPNRVAIGSAYGAQLYKVPVVATNINDEKNNTTRFVLLSKIKPQVTEHSKVSITFSTLNKPGALNKVLTVFEKNGLNMSQISSRPSRKELGEYVFYVDIEGHIDGPTIQAAFDEMKALIKDLEILSEGAILV